MDLNTIKNGSLAAIIVIGVVGVLLAIFLKKVIGKIISLVLAAVLVFFGWQQRSTVISYADELRTKACATIHPDQFNGQSFFGITVKIPTDWCGQPAKK